MPTVKGPLCGPIQALSSENTTYVSSFPGSEFQAILNKLRYSRCLQLGLSSSVLIVEISYLLPRAAQRTFCSANAVVLRTEVSELWSGTDDEAECALADMVLQDAASNTIVTKSKPSDFPSYLRQKLSTTQTIKRHEVNTEATTTQTCPKCARTEVRFSAVQLRSADEGSTIFYTCDCGYKYVYQYETLHGRMPLLTIIRWSENN